jgi:hypothetical protein
MTTYPPLTPEYSKIVNVGENCLITLVGKDISVCFGENPSGPGHMLTSRMTNGLRFDTGAPYDIYAKTVDGLPGVCALTKWA